MSLCFPSCSLGRLKGAVLQLGFLGEGERRAVSNGHGGRVLYFSNHGHLKTAMKKQQSERMRFMIPMSWKSWILYINWAVVSNMFMFIPIWTNDPIWLIFFEWVETTNYRSKLLFDRLIANNVPGRMIKQHGQEKPKAASGVKEAPKRSMWLAMWDV